MLSSLFPKTERQVSKLGFGAFGLKGVFGSFDESETIVGKALKSWSGEAPFIATKAECIGSVKQWGVPQDVEARFPKGHITREAEISLRELGSTASTCSRCTSTGRTGE
jgi:hypothetical protein